MLKKCYICKKELELENFHYKRKKDGLRQDSCKVCTAEYGREYCKKNKDKIAKRGKKYHQENRDSILKKQKKYRIENRDRIRKYYLKNREKFLAQKREYRLQHIQEYKLRDKRYQEKNKDKIKIYRLRTQKYRNIYKKNKLLTDINFKIGAYLRTRLWHAIKRDYKCGSAVKDLGCSISELKIYLEKQFKEGMTWDNYGQWHIDHKIPLVIFNLEDRNQLLQAVHYSNLQPLWAYDNLVKHDKILEEYLT